MTPAEPAPGQLRRTRCRCASGSRGQEAVTSGVTVVLAGRDAAVWHQEADLPEPRNPGCAVPAHRAGHRNFQIPGHPGGHHAGIPRPAAPS
jgi:hypothetical protein